MLGTWAVSCEAPASFDNPKLNFVRSASGDVVRHLQVGQPNRELLVAVELAEQIDASTLHMRERNLSGYGAADGRIYRGTADPFDRRWPSAHPVDGLGRR